MLKNSYIINIPNQLLFLYRSYPRYKEKSVITKVVTLFSFLLVSPDSHRDSQAFIQRFFLRVRMESQRVLQFRFQLLLSHPELQQILRFGS
jgi:hypothetical protein